MAGLGIGQILATHGEEVLSKTLPDHDSYELTLVKAIPGMTGTGKQKITLVFKVDAGPNFPTRPGVAPKSTVGRTVSTDQTWSPSSTDSVRIFLETMDKLGASEAWRQELVAQKGGDYDVTMEDFAKQIVGVKVLAKLTTDEEWSRNNVRVRKQLRPPTGAGAAAPTAGTAASAGTGPVVEETLGDGDGDSTTDDWMV